MESFSSRSDLKLDKKLIRLNILKYNSGNQNQFYVQIISLKKKNQVGSCSSSQTGISTIRPTAVPETGVSRHHSGPVKSPPENPGTIQQYGTEGFKGSSELGPYSGFMRKFRNPKS